MTPFKTMIAAIALSVPSAFLTTLPLAAETDGLATMQQGLNMLQTSLSNTLPQYGVDIDVSALTLEQIVQIMAAIKENNSDPVAVRSAVEVAIEKES